MTNGRRLVIPAALSLFVAASAIQVLAAADAQRLNAMMAVERVRVLGGTVEVDRAMPGTPVMKVSLFSTHATDDDLVFLEGFPRLRELDLGETRVTDAGLARLKYVPDLESLDLDKR
jgi:hypothetical protein